MGQQHLLFREKRMYINKLDSKAALNINFFLLILPYWACDTKFRAVLRRIFVLSGELLLVNLHEKLHPITNATDSLSTNVFWRNLQIHQYQLMRFSLFSCFCNQCVTGGHRQFEYFYHSMSFFCLRYFYIQTAFSLRIMIYNDFTNVIIWNFSYCIDKMWCWSDRNKY